MRLYEFVDSDEQLLGIIKPILLRAKAEGASEINIRQLANDIEDSSVTPDLLVNVLNKHRNKLTDIISKVSLDSVIINHGQQDKMKTSADKDQTKMKNTAVKQALDNLK